MKLGIYIITYNRAKNLEQTLDYLVGSAVEQFPITIIDNCSTDNTIDIANSFCGKLKNLSIVSNKYNIGLGANFLKAFELSDFEYTWVLCDDDKISVTNFDDVLKVIHEGEVDLIHVGAHIQKEWLFGNTFSTPKKLIAEGYPYFKFASFIPCNIFKTVSFSKSIALAYSNIGNVYPHMPFLFSLYLNDKVLYISSQQLVIASPASDGYSPKQWYGWWMRTCELLPGIEDVRLAYLDQWKDIGNSSEIAGLQNFAILKQITDDTEYVNRFQHKYFTIQDINITRAYEKSLLPKISTKECLYRKVMSIKKLMNI